MKRTILIYFFLVMTMLFVGCKSSNENDYKVYEKKYTVYNKEQSAYTVKYAQVSGVSCKSLEDKINKTLKLSITEWLNKQSKWMGRSKIAVKCKTSKYLSLCYTVKFKSPNDEIYENPYNRIGVTIDMQTGERVYLDDLIKDTYNLEQKLENYNYGNDISPPIDSDDANEIIHNASISETNYLKEKYKTDPYVYELIIDYIGSKQSFYLTDNKLVITRDRYHSDDIYIDFKQ